jgi:hypothetical protein
MGRVPPPAECLLLACRAARRGPAGPAAPRQVVWTTPGILEALIPGRMQGHGGTEEVPG